MKLKVVYIVSSPRSGSTLLTNLLGELDGFFAAAEMRRIWYGMGDRRCGCGAPVRQCPVWSTALQRVGGEVGPVAADQVVRLQARTTGWQHLGRLLTAVEGRSSPAKTGLAASPARTYGHIMSSMYAGVAEATGARVIVDSSKSVSEAALLSSLPGIDSYVVHLLRDPRAVAYSWQRAARRQQSAKPQRSPVRTATGWVVKNGASEALVRRRAGQAATLRYEDFVTSTRAALSRVARLVREPAGDMAFLKGRAPGHGARHMVGGNALRFGGGPVTLREDTEWQHRLHPAHRASVTTITLPLLLRYGYVAARA